MIITQGNVKLDAKLYKADNIYILKIYSDRMNQYSGIEINCVVHEWLKKK